MSSLVEVSGKFGTSTVGTGGSQFFNTQLPPDCVLRRFILHECYLAGKLTSLDGTDLPQPLVRWEVTHDAGTPAAERIYSTVRRVPMVVAAIWSQSTQKAVFEAWYTAGDDELGFNQQTAKGGFTHPLSILRVDFQLFNGSPTGDSTPWALDFRFTAFGQLP